MAIFQIGKGQYEIDDALDPEQRNNAIRHIYQTMEATRQGSLGYSVDNAQKMLGKGAEALGRLTGFDALENYGAGVVEQQEKDLAEGRYVPDYQGSFTDQEGVMNKLGWTGEKIVENLATSGVALGGSVAALAAAPFSAPAATLIGGATLGTNLVMSTGEAALEAEEKTGDYSAGGALATGGIVAFLDRFGAKIPKDKIANMTGKELVDELVSKGYTNAASELVKTVTKKAVREGATEAAQENVIMTGAALQGADYNLDEVINKNIDSFVVGSGMGAGQSVASGGVKALVGTGDNVSGEPIQQETAAATFAQRLDRIAKEGQPTDDGLVPFNLNDVDRMSDNGARAVMDVAHTRIATEIKELSKVLRDKLNGKERDDFERELGALGEYVEIKDNDVVLSAAELRSSKNKTKSAITTGGYKAVERLVGDTREGQELLNLLRESQMLTSLHNKGYVGGLSQYTEGLNPFQSQAGYGDRSSLETVGRLGLSGAAGAATQGASLAAQLGAVGGARAVDAMTGSRSRVDKFVKDNQGGRPLTASGPSLREDQFQAEQDEIARVAAEEAQKQAQADADAQQQAQNAQETAEANRVAGQRNAPPTLESPQWTMETATGLDKNGVAMALRMLERLPSTPVGVRKAIDGYRKTIDTGGKVPNLSPLIRFVNSAANDNPQFIQRVAQPDTGVEQQQVQRDQTEAYKLTEGYRRGIAANQKAGSDLLKAMNADRSISPVIKAKLGTALTYLQSNLPKDPLGAIQSTVKELQDAGVSQELIQKYIAPYADRVAKQQPKPDVPQEVIEDRVVPVPYNNKRMQDAFGVTEPTLGGNYINLDDNNADVTGTSYTGGTVAIVDGKPVLETNNIPSDPATKDTGWKAKVNLFKKKAGWSWVDSPRTEETIVSTETRGKHHYSLATDFQTPVTLETYPNQKSEPRLRPSTYGEAVLGNKVGTISVRGKPHPVYDKVSIVPKGGEPRLSRANMQDYDTDSVYYHGTASDIKGFDKGFKGSATGARSAKKAFWFSDSEGTARSYANFAATEVPVAKLVEQANKAEADGDFDAYDRLLGEAEALEQQLIDERRNGQNIIPVYLPKDLLVKDMKGRSYDDFGVSDEVAEAIDNAKRDGRKGVKFLNLNDAIGRANLPATHIAIIDSSDIRSVNAQFDPSKQDSSDLLADEASPALAQATGPEVGGLPTPTKGSTSQDIPDPSKLELEEARDIITEISDDKPVRDMRSLTLLARAFNTDIAYVTSDADIQQLWQDYGITDYKAPRFNGSSNAFFIPLSQSVILPNGNLVYRDGVAGLAVVKTGDLVDKEGIPRSAFHEVAHAISIVNAEIGVLFNPYPIKNPFNNTSVGEYTIGNTFVNFFYNRIREMSDKDRKAFIAEVKAVQDRTDFNTDVFPDRREAYRPMSVHEGEPLISTMTADNLLTENIKRREKELKALNKELQSLRPRLDAYEAKIRNNTSLDNYIAFNKRDIEGEFGPSMGKGLFDLFEREEVLQDGDILKSSVTGLRFNDNSLDDYDLSRLKSKREKLKKHIRKYQWNLREIVVDPIMLAISNPRLSKEVSPQFYKMLQEFFNSKDGPKFLSIILPMLMMLNMEDEEDERNMMAQGALSPQGQGALAMV